MRDDPIDRQDALFIVHAAAFTPDQIRRIIREARIPLVPEIAEQFERCSIRFLK